MIFVPYNYAPRSVGYQPGVGPTAKEQPSAIAMIPRAREIDLSDINGGVAPVAGTTYTSDYFLMHPLDESFQQMWLSAYSDVAFEALTVQLVQKQDTNIVELQQPIRLNTLLIDPTLIDQCSPFGTGPIFLRVSTLGVVDATIYVTVYTLTTEMS